MAYNRGAVRGNKERSIKPKSVRGRNKQTSWYTRETIGYLLCSKNSCSISEVLVPRKISNGMIASITLEGWVLGARHHVLIVISIIKSSFTIQTTWRIILWTVTSADHSWGWRKNLKTINNFSEAFFITGIKHYKNQEGKLHAPCDTRQKY